MLQVHTIPQFIQEASRCGTEGDMQGLTELEEIAYGWMIPEDERNALMSLIAMAELCASMMEDFVVEED